MNVPPLLQSLLWPLSLLYGVGVRARVWLYANKWFKQKRLKATVISVGNLTVAARQNTHGDLARRKISLRRESELPYSAAGIEARMAPATNRVDEIPFARPRLIWCRQESLC